MGTHPVLNAIGTAMNDPHAAVVDAEGAGTDLRNHGLEALPDRGTTRDHLDRPGEVDRDAHPIGRSEAALLDEAGEAHAHRLALRATRLQIGLQPWPVECIKRLLQQQGVIAGIEDDVVLDRLDTARERHLLGAYQVATAQFDRVDAHALRDRIEQSLAHERTLESPRRAISGRRRLVGEPVVPGYPVGWQHVPAGQDPGRHVRHPIAMGAYIGTLIVEELVIHGEHEAIGGNGRTDSVNLLARLVGGHQRFVAVFDPLHRALQTHGREQHQHVLGVDLAAHAKAATHVKFKEVNGVRTAPEHACERIAIAVRHLGGTVQFEHIARGIVATDRTAGLERHARVAPSGQFELDRAGSLGKRRLDIPIAFAYGGGLGGQARRKFAKRRGGIGEHRQRLEVEAHAFGRVFGNEGVGCKDRRDRIPDIAHPIARQNGLQVGVEFDRGPFTQGDTGDADHILRGPDRHHATHGKGLRGVNAEQSGMGHRRAHHAHVQLMRKRQVGGKPALTAYERQVFQARDRLAEWVGPIVVRRGRARHRHRSLGRAIDNRRLPGGGDGGAHAAPDVACIALLAARTASTMFLYPVHRHRFDDKASCNSASLGGSGRSRSAVESIRNPGVQNPHCRA